MATENRHHRYEAEEIRVDITTGEPVFVNGKFNPVPFKFKAEHKAGYPDYVHYRGCVHYEFCNVIKLYSVIKFRLCVHSVKKEKTHYNVQKHKKAVKKCL